MKVLIISPCGLPIPATKGGAVSTLIEILIIQNEKNQRIDLSVVGIHDQEAIKKSKEYKNTNFIFIKETFFCKMFDKLYEEIYNFVLRKRHKFPKRYLYKIYLVNKMIRHLKKETYDIVVFENAGYLLKIVKNKKIANKYKDKLFYHLHNDIPDNINIECLKKCKILSISEYLKKKILLKCQQGIEQNFYILKNGFDCAKFCKELSEDERIQIRRKLRISKEDKVVLFAGRINAEKGINELIQAFEELNYKNTKLLVIGSHNFGANQTSKFEQEIHTKLEKLGDKVRFTGFIPYSEIGKYYQIADVAVLPSIWEEPAGLTMLEATAAAIPLITTRSGGIPEYLNEKQVILIDRDENLIENIKKSIQDILQNEEKYKEIAKQSSKYVVENYNEYKFYENFIECINK